MKALSNQTVDSALPIAEVASQVCDLLRKQNVVLQAEPGAGKSTGLPLELLRAGVSGKILMLEPRRLAAMNVASRLASQLNEPLGKTVGLRMRGRTAVSSHTRLEVVTEGVLTRVLQNDPLLDGISVVIFDEFHERSLHADLGLALCIDVQRSLREDLRLLLMSATLDGDQLCRHLGIDKPVVCKVRQHPVDIVWCGESRAPLAQAVASVTLTALATQSGDALVFLPGVSEIEKTARILMDQLPADVELHRLHSGVGNDAQLAATGKHSKRRLILSTSIAETSITIAGVNTVIDSGLERRSRVDGSTGAERLETVMASQASATQRAGRAGRTGPGMCYRLWSETSHSRRAVSWQPEILRTELSSLLVEAGQWGASDVTSLPWIDAPPEASVKRAITFLQRLHLWRGAEHKDDGLTEYGRAVAKLPLHPRIGHMLLWACKNNAVDQACKLAALIEDNQRRQGVDLTIALQQQTKTRTQRASQLKKMLPNATADETQVPGNAVILAQAYPDRIARRRTGVDARYLLSGGAGVFLAADDPLAQSEWLAVAEVGGGGKEARIFSAIALEKQELTQWCTDLIDTHEHIEWDDKRERVIAEQQQRIGAIVLESTRLEKVNPQQRSAALMAGVRRKGLACLEWTPDVLEWQARVTRMRALEGEDTMYPPVDNESLLASLEDWLLPFTADKSSIKSLSQINLIPVLSSLIDYAQQQKLDDWLPTRYAVPSGAQHKLCYACDGNPVLAVKLQEMFGCRQNPSLAQGRLPLKIELLSPARRPVQITEDLANFWHNSYPAVKKDLAGRYPKHPWPDNPLEAQATARAKPRKK